MTFEIQTMVVDNYRLDQSVPDVDMNHEKTQEVNISTVPVLKTGTIWADFKKNVVDPASLFFKTLVETMS